MFEKIRENVKGLAEKVEVKILSNKGIVRILGITTTIVILGATPAYAAPAIGQNGATYVLEQLSWFILAGTIGLAAKAYSKGNTARMLISAVVGGIVYLLCKNPTKVEIFAKWIFEILGI